MPGLFDNIGQNGGLLGLLTGHGAGPGGLAGTLDPTRQQMAIQQGILQAQLQSMGQMPDFQGPGGIARALATIQNPKLQEYQFQQKPQQQQLEQTLSPTYGAAPASIFAQRPELLDKMVSPQKLESGDVLNSPMGFPGLGGGVAAPSGSARSAASGVSGGVLIAANNTGMLSPDTLTNLAERGILGEDVLGRNEIGAGKLGQINKTNLQNKMNELMKRDNISPQDMAARKAKFPAFAKAMDRQTQIEQQMGTGGIEFQKIWQQFASEMQRSGMTTRFPSINALDQFMREHAGDGGVIALKAYLNGLENTYSRAITTSQRGPTVDAHAHIREILSRFWGPAGLQKAGEALSNEIEAARQSIPVEENRLKVQFGLGKRAPVDMLNEAQAKIRAGVDRSKILQKMEDMGFHSSGL